MYRRINYMEKKEIKEVADKTEEKLIRLLQLARRAGKLKFGISMLKTLNKKIKVMIISKDISENNLNKIIKYNDSRIQIIMISDMKSIGDSIGHEPVSVIAITDTDFSNGILKLITQ